MLVTVMAPGTTTFWLSSPPCDDEDDPTKVAKKEQKRLENVHPSNHKLSKMFLPKCVGLCQKQHFMNRRRRILIY
jgi:hypothetical protein